MNNFLKPIIHTYHLAQYTVFLNEVFGITTEFIDSTKGSFRLNDNECILQELPKKRTKLLNDFEIGIDNFKELESLKSRLEFYYYRNKIKYVVNLTQLPNENYQVLALDPDKREIKIVFERFNKDFIPLSLNDSYN